MVRMTVARGCFARPVIEMFSDLSVQKGVALIPRSGEPFWALGPAEGLSCYDGLSAASGVGAGGTSRR